MKIKKDRNFNMQDHMILVGSRFQVLKVVVMQRRGDVGK